MITEKDRLLHGISAAEPEDLFNILAAAIRLERALYAKEDTKKFLFRLRKCLEGVWGHELPMLDEYGEELPPEPSSQDPNGVM